MVLIFMRFYTRRALVESRYRQHGFCVSTLPTPMRPLPESFTKDKFSFSLLQRTGNVALFSKSKPHINRPFFEVVKVQQSEEHSIAGHLIPASEHLPSSESWGTSAWSYSSLQDAQSKFQSLTSQTG